MGSICVREMEARFKGDAAMMMDFLIFLDRRGIVKSEMRRHMDHGLERTWSSL